MNDLTFSVLSMGLGLFCIIFGGYKVITSYSKQKNQQSKPSNLKQDILDDDTNSIFDNIEEKP